MKALIATKETQGWRKNDFCHCNEGELVTYGSECDGETVDGGCGCKRALIGFDSGRATTAFRVTTVDLTEEQLWELLRGKLTREGWIGRKFPEPENEEFLRAVFTDTVDLWRSFGLVPDGAVIDRRGRKFNRRIQNVAENRATYAIH